MPYVPPIPSSVTTPARPRLSHTRTRSWGPSFLDEQEPDAFVSLGSLPRRKPTQKKALFHFSEDQDQQEEDSALFPTSSSLLSPLPPTESQHPPHLPAKRSQLQRNASSSIGLSNCKPLTSSLKPSSSTPHIPQIAHVPVQSALAIPNVNKIVHFAEGLESVRLFRSEDKPANISRPAGEETESESEAEPSAYPFPQCPTPSPQPAQSLLPIIDSGKSSPLPNSSNPHANIHIESLSFPSSRPAALYGSVLVRSIAFEPQVAVRFTLDNWQTTSEVLCKHVNSLPRLPPPFPGSRTVGDAIGLLASGDSGSQECNWDRFSFVIHLELYEQKLAEHSIVFVGRFTAPGVGEWWDNNDGMYYRVSFKQPPTLNVPTLRNVSPITLPDRTFRPPLADRRGIPGGFTRYQFLESPPLPARVTSPVQTPTFPRSRSDSLDELAQPSALHPEPRPKAVSGPIFKAGVPTFTSLRSSPRSPPPISASPALSSRYAFSSSLRSSRPSPTGPMSPLPTELPSSELHEALVKQWCFAQSSPPTPGVFSRGRGSPVEEEAPNPQTDAQEGEPSSSATAWWMGNGADTGGCSNWTSDAKSEPGQILGH